MKRLIYLGIASFLLSLFVSSTLYAANLSIQAYIDGRSHLYIRGSNVWWHHYDYVAPGRYGGDQPTILNGVEWYPEWPEDDEEANWFCDCDSSVYGELLPPLSANGTSIELQVIAARGEVSIVQQPFKSNDYTAIVEFNDNRHSGPDWYDIVLSYDESTDLALDIKANGSDGPVDINTGDNLSITVELDSGDYTGEDADWWIAVNTPFDPPNDWFYYDLSLGWTPGLSFTYQGPLINLGSIEVLNMNASILPEGTYTFYFAVDTNMNGSLDYDQLYYSSVEVNVNTCQNEPCIRITKIWSDQFPNVEANFLPGGSGTGGYPYIVLGARSDNKAYVKAEFTIIPDVPVVRENVIVQLTNTPNEGIPVTVGEKAVINGNIASMSVNPTLLGDTYFAVAWVDFDGDSKLGPTDHYDISDFFFVPFTKGQYNDARTELIALANSLGFFAPTARSFLNSFLWNTTPDGANLSPDDFVIELNRAGSPTHNVGFIPSDSQSAKIREHVFSSSSELSDNIINSVEFRTLLDRTLADNANDVICSNQNQEYVFRMPRSIQFFTDVSSDLFYTFGAADIDVTLRATVGGNDLELIELGITGELTDLYDWDFEEGLSDIPGVILQAGFNTLGNSGHIFRTKVIFDTVIDYNFSFGDGLGTKCDEEECVNIAGNWFGTETVTITCCLGGDCETETFSGTDSITIQQNGCNISYDINISGYGTFSRTGTIDGNNIQLSGIFVVLQPWCSATQNVFTASGTINSDEINLHGSGIVEGTCDDISFSCTGNSTAVLTRPGSSSALETMDEEEFISEPSLQLLNNYLEIFTTIAH